VLTLLALLSLWHLGRLWHVTGSARLRHNYRHYAHVMTFFAVFHGCLPFVFAPVLFAFFALVVFLLDSLFVLFLRGFVMLAFHFGSFAFVFGHGCFSL
jgi:hypothetical protein